MSIFVLYDGHCGFCRRSVRVLTQLDWFGKLSLLDMHNEVERLRIAPEIPLADLDKALHIKLPDGSSLSGFSAFRRIAWVLPPLWIAAPFLYLPGMKLIGDRVYAAIAKKRKTCTHESCAL